MSQLLDFYRGHAPDSEGRMISEYWTWDDEQMEFCHRSIARFLQFLGLTISANCVVGKSPHFDRRLAIWRHTNHNWLRITRLLKSMRLLGFTDEAAGTWQCLRSLHEDDGFVSETSFAYWHEAANGLA